MSQAYVIEVRSQTVGIVVRSGRHFRFFASSFDYNAMEGRLFNSPKAAERAAFAHITLCREPQKMTLERAESFRS